VHLYKWKRKVILVCTPGQSRECFGTCSETFVGHILQASSETGTQQTYHLGATPTITSSSGNVGKRLRQVTRSRNRVRLLAPHGSRRAMRIVALEETKTSSKQAASSKHHSNTQRTRLLLLDIVFDSIPPERYQFVLQVKLIGLGKQSDWFCPDTECSSD